jgi:hypothetical protein
MAPLLISLVDLSCDRIALVGHGAIRDSGSGNPRVSPPVKRTGWPSASPVTRIAPSAESPIESSLSLVQDLAAREATGDVVGLFLGAHRG